MFRSWPSWDHQNSKSRRRTSDVLLTIMCSIRWMVRNPINHQKDGWNPKKIMGCLPPFSTYQFGFPWPIHSRSPWKKIRSASTEVHSIEANAFHVSAVLSLDEVNSSGWWRLYAIKCTTSISSSQLTNSYFSEGLKPPTSHDILELHKKYFNQFFWCVYIYIS